MNKPRSTHLFYVDELKLFGTNDSQLTRLVNTVKKVSDDIKIEFGLDKCAKAKFKSEQKRQKGQTDLEPEATYNCLGMEDGNGSDHHKMKAKIQKEYKRRISLVLKSRAQCKKQDSCNQ